jgi:hypothetical protein
MNIGAISPQPNAFSGCGTSQMKHRENFNFIGCTVLLIYCITTKVSWSGLLKFVFQNSPNLKTPLHFLSKAWQWTW